MLKTPFGNLRIQKNNIDLDYTLVPKSLRVIDKCDYYVDERYQILIKNIADIKAGDILKCFIDIQDNVETNIDGGECLALLDFETEDIILSLGAYEMLYHFDDTKFGFDINYMRNGLEVYFFDNNYTNEFKLAISWMKKREGSDLVSTWYASDPTIY